MKKSKKKGCADFDENMAKLGFKKIGDGKDARAEVREDLMVTITYEVEIQHQPDDNIPSPEEGQLAHILQRELEYEYPDITVRVTKEN
jgi:hypothetical protein